MINTVIDYLFNSLKKYPNKVAIVYNEKSMTYSELYQLILKVKDCISRLVGMQKRSIVVMMKNSDKAIATFLGITLSGNIYVPLDIDMPKERFKTILQ